MTSEDSLHRGYSRLLRWFPASHRDRHADEMLGVLLAGAGPGQRRPGVGESANLIAGALRIRLRAATLGSTRQWRDALALASVVLPVAAAAESATRWARFAFTGGVLHVLSPAFLTGLTWGPLPPLLLAVVVLAGWRRGALALTAALGIGLAGYLATHAYFPFVGPDEAQYLWVLGVEAVALVASAGPRRGRALLSWKHYLLIVAVAAAAGVTVTADWWLRYSSQYPVVTQFLRERELATGAVVTVVAAVMLAVSGTRRRLLAILALPLYFFVLANVMPALGPLGTTLTYLPFAALPCVAALLIRRRARPAQGRPG